ncbi:SAM-dependent methyltransferase [Bacillus sp. sid0103]|uniref:TrmO family methyltransferase domain-containing protein n=1 Tax=Bacillus sp. sid0103 TaxID=2856337 RepID=UPI001C450026|nr:SAM-dependent methyltransferase [Bacillus sp. sid0103]
MWINLEITVKKSGRDSQEELWIRKRSAASHREQYRPNPIGIAVVKLETIQGNFITVTGLDAINGTY